ncbi:DUF916 and DUF3324 domain-containing protein [Vagococcus sp. BWB3-3]|uniref:DUF916 and DUF3324 domain-containing protein n=1 Tax=Vagococcus allomyrinae TaxID=2794353 RepID=A0A940P9I9_9ENTE|nr:DUF916 and DUF3324 domain-containing protein [Vagococcus allomyrinae]MBP1044254.1 DUF916 and DUF3324 domain-containing protein [Vagococcus allomyrinae]
MSQIENKVKLSLLILVFALLSVLPGKVMLAAEENGANGEISESTGFTYKINFPENQIDSSLGYFKLKMQPNQTQKISLTLGNLGSEKTTVEVGLNGAKTNQNGVVEYGDSPLKNDPSLKFDFTDIVSGPETVELGPKEVKDVEITIQMPKENLEGVVAGGIYLSKANQGESSSEKSTGSKVVNKYAYIVAVVLQEAEEVTLKPDLEFNQVFAGQNNYRNAILVNFSNVIATYLYDMAIDVQISKKSQNEVLYERKELAMKMAPNSFIEFPVSMNGEKMVNGDYSARILVTSQDQKWEWIEDFKITQKEADKFNQRDVSLVQEKGIDWRVVFLLVISGIVIVGVIVGGLKLSQHKKNQAKSSGKSARRKKGQ